MRRYAAMKKDTGAAVANVLATNLQGHYDFTTLDDHSGNGRTLSTSYGGSHNAGFNSDGYRLEGGDALGAAFTAFSNQQDFTLQVVVKVHTDDDFMAWMKLEIDPFGTQADNRIEIGTRDTNPNIGSLIYPDGGNSFELKTATAHDGTTAMMATVRWRSSDDAWHIRKNKTQIDNDTVSGTISPDDVVFTCGSTGSVDLVYGVWYDAALTDAECDSNYDEIRTIVNQRPNVNLPA